MLSKHNNALTLDAINERRYRAKESQQVTFQVTSLYGLSPKGIHFPLNEVESIESGSVCVTLDPESDSTGNVGIVDFKECKLTVRYAVQVVFPGLYKLVTSGKYAPSLLNPVRAVATDECTLTPDYSGWRALGCLDFLPGSIWAGATGG